MHRNPSFLSSLRPFTHEAYNFGRRKVSWAMFSFLFWLLAYSGFQFLPETKLASQNFLENHPFQPDFQTHFYTYSYIIYIYIKYICTLFNMYILFKSSIFLLLNLKHLAHDLSLLIYFFIK